MVKKRCKFVKKWPRRSPEWTQNGCKIEKRAFKSPKGCPIIEGSHSWAPSCAILVRWTPFSRFWVHFESILGSSGAIFGRICIVFWPCFWCHLFIFACFFLSISWYLWWVGWINVVGNLGVVSWWLGGMMMSPVFHPPSLTLSPLRVYKAATQQDSRKRTRQQRNGIVRQSHNKPTRKQRSKTAGQHDNKTATKPPTNPPTNWCGPVECAKRLNNNNR